MLINELKLFKYLNIYIYRERERDNFNNSNIKYIYFINNNQKRINPKMDLLFDINKYKQYI